MKSGKALHVESVVADVLRRDMLMAPNQMQAMIDARRLIAALSRRGILVVQSYDWSVQEGRYADHPVADGQPAGEVREG